MSSGTTRAWRAGLAAFLAVCAGACGVEPEPPSLDGRGAGAALVLSSVSYPLSTSPELAAEVRRSPYRYFRLINRELAQRICELVEESPAVNLHGDAHLEQYAVTDESRGLMDFDDSALGPAVLDLARFGVSVALAARANGWEPRTEALLLELLAGYQAALVNPAHEAPVPKVVERVRAGFTRDRKGFLESAEARMSPRSREPREMDPASRRGLRLFAEAMLEQHPEMPPDFFEVKTAGELHTGIGSAADTRYLFRVEGPTHASDDDLVFEAKMLRELDSVSCMERSREDPTPIFIAQSQIAYQPYEHVGYVYLYPEGGAGGAARVFWVHSWIENYEELSIEESFASVEELREVVYDVGVQLGRGHPKTVGVPGDPELREALLYMADARSDDYFRLVPALTEEVVEAWGRFAGSSP